MQRRDFLKVAGQALAVTATAGAAQSKSVQAGPADFWQAYEQLFLTAKYVDLTHVLTPHTPLWRGFDRNTEFARAVSGSAEVKAVGAPFTYQDDGFEATAYRLPTDQFGTQLDPPAHWNPHYPAIDELPASLALRPLVVISIAEQVKREPGYHLQVEDVTRWEGRHGRVPAGSVVMVRSDWYKGWGTPDTENNPVFPGVGLAALKFLHLERQILFHGHEPLDTDTTPTLEGEDWLLNHGYMQAEGVAYLDQVPETGALLSTGFPKFQGGTGGFARYVAVCPADWPYGQRPDPETDAPFARQAKALQWDAAAGTRVRK